MSLPVLAATLAFVTYSLTTHDFNSAVIFSSLSLFQVRHSLGIACNGLINDHLLTIQICQLLRQPMMLFPRALSVIPDAFSAFHRLSRIFHAELIEGETLVINKTQEYAIIVQGTTFEWESSEQVDGNASDVFSKHGEGAQSGRRGKRVNCDDHSSRLEDSEPSNNNSKFKVTNVTLTVPRGQLAAIVGPVGSGKVLVKFLISSYPKRLICVQSSLLQGIIGEMRKVSGNVSLGGNVAYCPQMAWIQNATLVCPFSLRSWLQSSS